MLKVIMNVFLVHKRMLRKKKIRKVLKFQRKLKRLEIEPNFSHLFILNSCFFFSQISH